MFNIYNIYIYIQYLYIITCKVRILLKSPIVMKLKLYQNEKGFQIKHTMLK